MSSSNDSPGGAAAVTPNTTSPDQTSPLPAGTSASSARVQPSNAARSPLGPNAQPTPATDSRLNPRSCVTCRRRKVRCNKREPCSNCVKAGIECIFPGPGRAPRKPRRPPDAELLSRLRRLEGVVESLGGTSTLEQVLSGAKPTQLQTTSPLGGVSTANNLDMDESDPKNFQPKLRGTEELGRLVIDDTKSRYVSNRFWATLGDQIEELQDILDHSSDDEEDFPSPGDSVQSGTRSHDAFIFGYSSLAHSLRNYHPTPTQAFVLWKTYEQHIAPLLTIVHKPSIRNIIIDAATNLDSLDKNTEALAFSVYLAAVISMTPDQCLSELGEERDATISRFRFATEQGMAKANLLNSQNITLLQAAVVFLSCIRRQDDSRFVWTLSAVILRLASGLGLHRDGTHFGLSPFETEMRRRLWWHICILDVRAAEDHGTDPMINDMMYDTRLPLNINDDDISPDSKTSPPEKVECTDMTFALIRCEVTLAYRRLTYIPPGLQSVPSTVEERESLIEKLHQRLNDRYIKHCDMQIPLQWACATIARLIVAKLWLIVHHPLSKPEGRCLSNEARNKILLTSIEVIEFSRLLETNENTTKWSWLFSSYTQWHAVAFVLAELCVRPLCPGVDRAWMAVNSVFKDWERQPTTKKGLLWRPLSRLMKKATDFRKRQLEELRNKYGSTPATMQSQMPPILPTAASGIMNMNPPPPMPGSQQETPSLVSTSSPTFSTPFPNQIELPTSPMAGFSLDLNKGMPDLLNDVLPAYSMVPAIPNVSMPDVMSYDPAPTSNFADALFDPTIPTPASQTGGNAFEMPLNWDQFDDVMRDFQHDLAQGNNQRIIESMQMDFI
ncbi:fungal-specific transcription factor domain-containing protein [Talaromyces proteolyticus]|uniref:Fungal-specific transcription factor domain-containing protein n=1 Tax=Talaromyces proteolyticus TaxID=1131652 RepID=A0AAD4KZ00_9EURO|nr:fungal-specific transcription factor domain-containing protein [Talaromyces proteolyticus]KAH8700425.1 fungal-specific transcription factor domain-containing protein [Talaromyces proteolyticus]